MYKDEVKIPPLTMQDNTLGINTNEYIPKHKDKHHELAVRKWEMW